MRVLICPDKFAGTLTAVQAADAIAEGWRSARPGDDLVVVPLADGGEGTVAVVARAQPAAQVHTVEVADARGIATDARWLSLPDGTAVVEVAEVCGLSALPPADRDPLRSTTYGVGQLLRTVLATAPARVVVGLGGSATVDGGAGMMSALTGHALRRGDGNAVKVGGRWVAEVVRVDASPLSDLPEVIIASDVTNPLLGPGGAAAVFGPQKGADPDAVAELESALVRFADVVERDLPGGPWRDHPGAGAAGGLGFAVMALLGGQVRTGAEVVAELVGLDLSGVDVVVTGEGSLDAQTLAGKGPEVIRRQAAAVGARTVALAGRTDPAATAAFDVVEELGPDGLTDATSSLTAAAARAAGRIDGVGTRPAAPGMTDVADLKPASRRVVEAAAQLGITAAVTRFPEGTRTAADAARAIGCAVGAIAKSIVLTSDAGPMLVLTSGANRVDYAAVGRLAGVTGVRRADADEVRAATGYAIGGTAPFGHPQALTVLADADLLAHREVWAAAGTPDTVFPIAPAVLIAAVGAVVGDVAER